MRVTSPQGNLKTGNLATDLVTSLQGLSNLATNSPRLLYPHLLVLSEGLNQFNIICILSTC